MIFVYALPPGDGVSRARSAACAFCRDRSIPLVSGFSPPNTRLVTRIVFSNLVTASRRSPSVAAGSSRSAIVGRAAAGADLRYAGGAPRRPRLHDADAGHRDATRQAPRAGAGGRAAVSVQANDAGAARRRCSGRRARGPVRRRRDRRTPRSRVEPRGERPARRRRADASGRRRARTDQRHHRRRRARREMRERARSAWRRWGRAVGALVRVRLTKLKNPSNDGKN